MRFLIPFLALLVFPGAAVSQEDSPPKWSVGAGLFWSASYPTDYALYIPPSFKVGSSSGGYSSISSSSNLTGNSGPRASGSLERRVGERTWLVFGASGGVVGESDSDYGSPERYTVLRAGSWNAAISAGLRRVITKPTFPIEVSVLALADAGYQVVQWRFTDLQAGGMAATRDVGDASAGLSLGFAAERELVSRLSVRISASVLRAAYDYSSDKGLSLPNLSAEPDYEGVFRADVVFTPHLELRLAI